VVYSYDGQCAHCVDTPCIMFYGGLMVHKIDFKHTVALTDFQWTKFENAALAYIEQTYVGKDSELIPSAYVRRCHQNEKTPDDFIEIAEVGVRFFLKELEEKFSLFFPYSNIGCSNPNKCIDKKELTFDDLMEQSLELGEMDHYGIQVSLKAGKLTFETACLLNKMGMEEIEIIKNAWLSERIWKWWEKYVNG